MTAYHLTINRKWETLLFLTCSLIIFHLTIYSMSVILHNSFHVTSHCQQGVSGTVPLWSYFKLWPTVCKQHCNDSEQCSLITWSHSWPKNVSSWCKPCSRNHIYSIPNRQMWDCTFIDQETGLLLIFWIGCECFACLLGSHVLCQDHQDVSGNPFNSYEISFHLILWWLECKCHCMYVDMAASPSHISWPACRSIHPYLSCSLLSHFQTNSMWVASWFPTTNFIPMNIRRWVTWMSYLPSSFTWWKNSQWVRSHFTCQG